jgi:dihydrodipicolinate synthase/N-acetylneuraminate lyase
MHGIVPSLNTPFDVLGALDLSSLSKLVEHTVKTGCGGMLGLAVAGEHDTLNHQEKINFIQTVIQQNQGRIPFICSVTATTFTETLNLTKAAAAARVDGICVQLPPSLNLEQKLSFLEKLEKKSPGIIMVQDLDWSGGGLSLEEIVFLYRRIEKFTWLKIETSQAGPKYSAVTAATEHGLKVCGGWAVTQLMDAMARSVDAFVPTGLESIYVAIYHAYQGGEEQKARTLFESILPILNFSNQHIDISIKFFKSLRVREGLFASDYCRSPSAVFDPVQSQEAMHARSRAMKLLSGLN